MKAGNNGEDRVFEALLDYLRRSRGFDFTGYKRPSLKRRVTKQMQTHQIESFGDYLDYLEVHPEEFEALFNTILINVTGFFRDATAWQHLQQQILPQIVQSKSEAAPIRVWSAGCASGEEAYTIAIVLAELLGIDRFRQCVKIYATDVDEEALTQARYAMYPAKALETMPEELRRRYFEPNGVDFSFRADLRRAVIFGRHDLVQDAPISRLDLLVCRNALMYFNAETQARILARFHFALQEPGALFLGKAEMLLTHTNLFIPMSLQHRIFSKVPKIDLRDRLLVLAQTGDEEAGNRLATTIRMREAAFNAIPIAQIVVDFTGHLVLANTQARTMFNLSLQDIGRPIQDLEISYRPLELRSQIEQVYRDRQPILITDVVHRLPDRGEQYLDIQFSPLQENGSDLLGVSIAFVDVTRYHDLQGELHRSNQELETANEELQSSNEELETTNEELQSTNEELETTNEELQSTNEELETMNEELQSTNEELQTMNDELRLRTIDLNQANAFLRSILTSLQVGVIVVDRHFNILSWNEEAEDLWGLRAAEVEGQSLLGLDIGLPVAQLRNPIRNCLIDKGGDRIELVLEAVNRRGRSIQCRISFNPLIGYEGERQGVILLMGTTGTESHA
jgi:two-component system, chemotaxis family, CheB/CheR fusion protein